MLPILHLLASSPLALTPLMISEVMASSASDAIQSLALGLGSLLSHKGSPLSQVTHTVLGAPFTVLFTSRLSPLTLPPVANAPPEERLAAHPFLLNSSQ